MALVCWFKLVLKGEAEALVFERIGLKRDQNELNSYTITQNESELQRGILHAFKESWQAYFPGAGGNVLALAQLQSF